jgi:cytochrome c-type biogenesis protein CcmE
MSRKKWKYGIGAGLIIGIVIGVVFSVSSANLTYYYYPSEVLNEPERFRSERIRVMGLVAPGSVEWIAADTKLAFKLVDEHNGSISVVYHGVRPDMFREGQGVVVEGRLSEEGPFQAVALLVKHNEEYKITDHSEQKEGYLKTLEL